MQKQDLDDYTTRKVRLNVAQSIGSWKYEN
jgi:hypothetical protein